MKKSCAYQFELLLFLLLITFNPTLSGGIVSRGVVPFLFRIGRIGKYFERVHKRHKTTPDKIGYEFPPPKLTPPPSTPPELTPPPSTPPPSTPPELTPPPSTPPPLTQPPLTPSQQENQIEGLFLIKQLLYEFGYLQQRSGSTSFDDTFDEETKAAIDVYQNKFNLQVTGDLNKETFQQILLPRCGVPDINFEYNMSDTNYSWPKGIEWFPKGTKNLTYAFAPESEIPPKAIKVFKSAFTRWSTTTKLLNFTETSSYVDANIKIGFYSYDDMFDDVVVGDTFISLQSSAKSGVVRLDDSMIWILPTYNHTWSWQYGEIYLESVVMHQIGHLLGLDHSFEKDSIMYPTILPSQQQQRKVEITNSDNQTIHQLYSNAIEVSPNSGSSLPTALFLGFALMALLN